MKPKSHYRYYTWTNKSNRGLCGPTLWRKKWPDDGTADIFMTHKKNKQAWERTVDWTHQELNSDSTKRISKKEAQRRFPGAFPKKKRKQIRHRYYIGADGKYKSFLWKRRYPDTQKNVTRVFLEGRSQWCISTLNHESLSTNGTARTSRDEARKRFPAAFPKKRRKR